MNPDFHVGFTATRQTLPQSQLTVLGQQLQAIFDRFDPTFKGEYSHVNFHHGDCVGGDEQGHDLAMAIGFRVVVHPPFNPLYRAYCKGHQTEMEKSYDDRNRDIVNFSEILLACPRGSEERRSGTWSTIRYAYKRNHKVRIIFPNGNFTDLGGNLFDV